MAINHCGEIDYMVYKLKYDSTHGRFEKQVRSIHNFKQVIHGPENVRPMIICSWISVFHITVLLRILVEQQR